MSKCPSCKAEISSDEFGLITCSNCGAQVMAGMDEPEVSEEPQVVERPPVENAEVLTEDVPESTSLRESLQETLLEGMSEPANLSDIAEYGNSPVSQAREGLLRFHVCLTNIDTADVRKAVRDVLSEPRFLFNVEEILNSIRDGEVTISDVTPVKAAVLIQKLRALPVGISWEQYAIHAT